ncbi:MULTISPECIES: cupin domain-containing protein [unclassified Pseudomonas]|uniref:cupin domain-containing protein n=1 Tax=unclassified Pseudomonas TaxID=196821 RepID=UPI001A9FD9E4|nr:MULTISPECIES: cupin domain-containing protein [unclassified Pseudomonas]
MTATAPITVLRDTHPLPVLDACKWEKLEGDPHTVNLNAYTSEDSSKIMGTWICTPGKWRVDYVKWEYCHFQEGYCIITPDGMAPIHLRAGDIFVVEPGMKGTWEVVETVRKYFVFA